MAKGDRISNYNKEQVIDAIRGSYGIILTIAKKLGCESRTAKKLIERWKETKEIYDDEKEVILDISEHQVFKSVLEGDTATAKWILSKKGKARGYEDTPTIKVENDDPLNIKFDSLAQLTKEDIASADNIELGGEDVEGSN